MLPVLAIILSMPALDSCKTTSGNSTGKTLKFNFQKGKGYNYDMISDMSMNVMGMDTKVYVDGKYSMEVTNDDGQVKTISVAYKGMQMRTNILGMDLDVDTDRPVAADTSGQNIFARFSWMMSKMLSSIINKPFGLKVNAAGEIMELEGVDKLMEGIADSMHLDSTQRMQVMSGLKKQFGDNNIRNSFTELLTIFPNKEIKVGDSWDKTYTQMMGEVAEKNTTTYTVKQIDGDAVTLDAVTKMESGSGNTDVTVEGSKKSVMLVDSKNGLIINDDFTMDVKVKTVLMDMSMSGKGKIKGTAL